MRKSKPAAMCLTADDLNDLLVSAGYDPETDQFQPAPVGRNFDLAVDLADNSDLLWFVPRYYCESDESLVQILPYCLVTTTEGRIVGYNRAGKSAGEVRLAGNFSVGFGGHIELGDLELSPIERTWGLIMDAANRELSEEITITDGRLPHNIYCVPEVTQFLGVIRSRESAVDRVHVGLVFQAICNVEGMRGVAAETPEPDQIINPRLLTLEQARGEASPESWTAKILNSSVLDELAQQN